ncbi:hypothetical protein AMS68_005380 [Peltaster fructicola]|uniref:F-box domain-containing protein n=1 Tax=Peltaster fructicola TaxID=286661 RepID=A0A6H0XYM7_9PEZI|nr:hypothetical protein AMS68_005380 [Peltaster fructicola]
MDNLVPELLEHIASFLDSSTLDCFSRSSTNCRAASMRCLMNTISISFDSPEQFSASLNKTIDMLEATEGHKYVRHLRVHATHSLEVDRWYNTDHNDVWRQRHEDRCLVSSAYRWQEPRLLDLSSPWPALCKVVKSLLALRELTWATPEQIPLDILTHLHTLGRPRLHMLMFDLASLCCRDGRPPHLSTQELELARSPYLRSIDHVSDLYWYDDYKQDALLEIVAAGALRNLCIRNTGPPRYPVRDTQAANKSFDPWQAGIIRSTDSLGALDTLMLIGIQTDTTLKNLSLRTDFSVLKSLSLYGQVPMSTFSWLSELDLPLDHLIIGMQKYLVSVAIITSFTSLTSLRLDNKYDVDSLYEILRHFSERLRALHCKSKFIDLDMLAVLSQFCPRIEQLGFCMVRNADSAAEFAIYHSIGRLVAVKQVELHFRPHQVPPETISQNYYRTIDLKKEKQLVSSIVRAIGSSKPQYAIPLEEVRLNAIAR